MTLRTIARPPGRDGPAVWASTGARPYIKRNHCPPASVPAPAGSRLTGADDEQRAASSRPVMEAYSRQKSRQKFANLAPEFLTDPTNWHRITEMRWGAAGGAKVSAHKDSNYEIGWCLYATESKQDINEYSRQKSASLQKNTKTQKCFHRRIEICRRIESMRYAKRSMKPKPECGLESINRGARSRPKIGDLRVFYRIVNSPNSSCCKSITYATSNSKHLLVGNVQIARFRASSGTSDCWADALESLDRNAE